MTYGVFAWLLVEDTATLHQAVMDAFPFEVKAVLGRLNLSVEDLLALPQLEPSCSDWGCYLGLSLKPVTATPGPTILPSSRITRPRPPFMVEAVTRQSVLDPFNIEHASGRAAGILNKTTSGRFCPGRPTLCVRASGPMAPLTDKLVSYCHEER